MDRKNPTCLFGGAFLTYEKRCLMQHLQKGLISEDCSKKTPPELTIPHFMFYGIHLQKS